MGATNANPYGSFLIHINHMDQNGSIWIQMDPYGSIWIHVDPYGSLWIHMDPYGSIWIYMDLHLKIQMNIYVA